MKWWTVGAACLAGMAGMASAQDVAGQTEAAKALTTLLEEQKKLVEAQGDLARARVAALGLPSYSGETKLEEGAGRMEATQLAAFALAKAAGMIGAAVQKSGKVTAVLTATEPLDFGFAESIAKELAYDVAALEHALEAADAVPRAAAARRGDRNPERVALTGGGGAAAAAALGNPAAFAVAGIGAVAGLLRSDTTVSGFDASEIDAPMLVRAVAIKTGGRAVIPSAIVTTADDSPLLQRLEAASALSDRARASQAALAQGAEANAAQKASAALDLAVKRFDAFHLRVTSAGADGRLPIMEAARLLSVKERVKQVLRVDVDKAGGSLVNTKNIGTFFGADPIRVSGGLVVSYLLTDPGTGGVMGGGVLNCRTALTRLRRVQDGNFVVRTEGERAAGGIRAVCKAAD